MEVLLPSTLVEALEMKAEHPEAVPIAGGTDVMVLVNADLLRPETFLDVSRLPELGTWRLEDDELFVGAGVSNAATLTAWVRSGVGTQSGCGNKTALTACRAGAGKRRNIRSASIGGRTFNINSPPAHAINSTMNSIAVQAKTKGFRARIGRL